MSDDDRKAASEWASNRLAADHNVGMWPASDVEAAFLAGLAHARVEAEGLRAEYENTVAVLTEQVRRYAEAAEKTRREAAEQAAEMGAARDEAGRRVAALEAGLRPFAELREAITPTGIAVYADYRDCRRAAALLADPAADQKE